MAKRLVWTDKYNRSIENIFTCSQDLYSKGILKKLRSDIKRCENILLDNPQTGSIETNLHFEDCEIRRYIVSPFFKIIYGLKNDDIIMLYIWDNRRNPEILNNYFS